MPEINERTLVQVELSIGEWQAVIHVLSEGPHRIVAPLITKIGNSVKVFAEVHSAAPPLENGHDAHRAG